MLKVTVHWTLMFVYRVRKVSLKCLIISLKVCDPSNTADAVVEALRDMRASMHLGKARDSILGRPICIDSCKLLSSLRQDKC